MILSIVYLIARHYGLAGANALCFMGFFGYTELVVEVVGIIAFIADKINDIGGK